MSLKITEMKIKVVIIFLKKIIFRVLICGFKSVKKKLEELIKIALVHFKVCVYKITKY